MFVELLLVYSIWLSSFIIIVQYMQFTCVGSNQILVRKHLVTLHLVAIDLLQARTLRPMSLIKIMFQLIMLPTPVI